MELHEAIKDVQDATIDVLKSTLRRTNHVYHEDAGHAWLKVPRLVLRRLDLLDKISGYSYEYMGFVYLEEDMDAVTYLRVLFPEGFSSPEFTQFYSMYVSSTHDGDISRIRDFPHFIP